MKRNGFSIWMSLTLAVVALVCVLDAGRAQAAIPTCNGFSDAAGTIPAYCNTNGVSSPPAVAPFTCPAGSTATTPCTDYFGKANYANSPLPTGPIDITPTGVTIMNGGSGYTAPTVTISDFYNTLGAGITPASCTAILGAGVITSITCTSGGSGYMAPVVTITDATGTGAAALAKLSAAGPLVGGIRKFVDTMPSLQIAGVTAGLPPTDTTTFPGSDYYEIALVEFTQQMHADLPATKLRGYVQVPSGSVGCPSAPTPSYLGPIILAAKNRPVRVKFTNCLPTGAGGNLFIPVDTTYMGAGNGPDGLPYLENRATLHLHGGATPWISDGTPHQWTVPVGESTSHQIGDSTQFVPDMFFDSTGKVTTVPQCNATVTTGCYPTAVPAGLSNDPGQGAMTFFWTNQQGGRLMFYHDHAYGITRLNVYAGEAAGYLLADPAEETALAAATVPGTVTATPDLAHLIPLVIQDKTFVPGASQLAGQDPTWIWSTATAGNGNGDLWFPHVYTTNQNPADPGGANAFGRWDYGAWFFPPMTSLTAANPPTAVTIPCTSAAFPGQMLEPTVANNMLEGCPITPNPSGTPEGFMDTPVINGKAYPVLHVAPEAYRFQILSVGNDRSWNLQLYVADATGKDVAMLPSVPPATGTPLPLCPAVNTPTQPALGIGLTPAILDPTTGNPINGTGLPANCWPNYGSPSPGIPSKQFMWPADGRDGGIPDPRLAGPPFIQIGTEGGLLPAPVVIPSTPIGYEYNTRSITITSVSTHGLWLGPAERADAIVDFSAFAGKTLILYNDAPTPAPAFDGRLDYFTGDVDASTIGGAPTTMPGYGPNTRTVMQIVVDQPTTAVVPFSLKALQTQLPTIYAATQPTPIIPEPTYTVPSGGNSSTATYSRISDNTISFTPLTQMLANPCTALGYPAVTTPAATPACVTMDQKAIQELFTLDYGRMNATLGVELALTNFQTQTTVPYGYVDWPTEIIQDGQTQIWKITHNGVDTHFIHFHLVNVQVINRMGWDGSVRPPDQNELGWKETVRMNPLEDVVVAMKAVSPQLPFPIPDSIRLMDPTAPVSLFDMSISGLDPTGGNVTLSRNNAFVNFGWEYVWHCHILGHEENDMMRPITFQVAPPAPSNLTASTTATPGTVSLTWTVNSVSDTGFVLQRATDANFATNLTVFTNPTLVPPLPVPHGYGMTVQTTDTGATGAPTFFYRVQAVDDFTPYSPVPVPWQNVPMGSVWSNVATIGTPAIAALSPTALAFGSQLVGTPSAAQTVTLSNSGGATLVINSITSAGTNPGDFVQTNNCTSLATGASCTISVVFNPTAIGARAGMLNVNTSDPANPTLSASLSGTGIAPVPVLTPTTLTFANQLVGTPSVAQTVTLSNATGTAPLAITTIATAGDFAQTNTCGTSLAVGASCTISVTFNPTVMGARTGTLSVNVAAPATNQSVALSGTGIAPVPVLTPTTLTFANQLVGTPSVAQTVTLSNATGTAPLAITTIATAGDFAQTNTCGTSLAVGASCTISVTFNPTVMGARTGTLSVNVAAPATNQSAALSGTGIAPVAGVSPASLTFALQVVNTTSASQTVTLSNTGTAPLGVNSIALNGANANQFSITSNTCGASLATSATCTINVAFKPTTAGVQAATLAVSVAAPATSQSVALSGTSSAINVSTTSLAFGPQLVNTTSAASRVTLTNDGTTALTITGVTLGGTNPGDFAMTNNCGATLNPRSSCTINVRFGPTATGVRAAAITVNTSDPAGPQTISLSGTGIASAATVTPGTLTFSSPLNVTTTAQTITLSNTGTAPLGINSIRLGGINPNQFSITSNACGASLAAGSSCTINVAFRPTGTAAAKSALLNVNLAAPATSQSVTLTGTVITPVFTVSPTSLSFGTQTRRTSSAPQTVTVSNTGAAPLTINNVRMGGTNPNQFRITSNTCGASLAVGSSCTISVTFSPTTAGAKSAVVNVNVAAPATSLPVPLSGTGL